MDATTYINQNLDVEKLLRHYNFEHITVHNDLIRACCKLHNGNNPTAFVINKNTGLWYCHTGNCGGGDIFTLVERFEGFSKNEFPRTVRWLASFFNLDISNLTITQRSNYLKELQQFIRTIQSTKPKQLSPFYIEEEIREVTKYRDFQYDTIKFFNLGYVESIKLTKRSGDAYYLRNRLVFPVFFNNIQVGVSLRRVNNNDYPKWSHQPVNVNFGDFLYNYDNVKAADKIVICEGITDVWAFHECNIPAVSTFGAHITNEQYKLLLQTGADLIFAFDGDEAGAIATKKAIELFKNKANIQQIIFGQNQDPASIKRKELVTLFEHRKTPWY
jgi:DNA primase